MKKMLYLVGMFMSMFALGHVCYASMHVILRAYVRACLCVCVCVCV